MAATDNKASEQQVMVEHLFREESGKMLAVLTRLFGFGRIELVEDIVQETFLAALRTWSYGNIPENPPAWLMQVAKNKALNELQRLKTQQKNSETAAREFASFEQGLDRVFLEHEIEDSRLRLLFACCHPSFPVKAQIVFTLRSICGLGIKEIAAGLLMSEDAVAKTLVRVKKEIREKDIPLSVPFVFQSFRRIEAVLTVIYLTFNEGYKSSSGSELLRVDLCYEAIRLARLLCGYNLPNIHEAYALLALLCLNFARFTARRSEQGDPFLLREQDRSLWDANLIAQGFYYLGKSREGKTLSRYHLEAGIAAAHCSAASFEGTNWELIIRYYDLLVLHFENPYFLLNRAIAVGNRDGAAAGISALEEANRDGRLGDYYLYYAAMASFYFELEKYPESAHCYTRAFELSDAESDRKFLAKRIELCTRYYSN